MPGERRICMLSHLVAIASFVPMFVYISQCRLSLDIVPSECSIVRVDDPRVWCLKISCRSNRQMSVYFQFDRSRSGVSPLVSFLGLVDVNPHTAVPTQVITS